jgi:hypothetical protein
MAPADTERASGARADGPAVRQSTPDSKHRAQRGRPRRGVGCDRGHRARAPACGNRDPRPGFRPRPAVARRAAPVQRFAPGRPERPDPDRAATPARTARLPTTLPRPEGRPGRCGGRRRSAARSPCCLDLARAVVARGGYAGDDECVTALRVAAGPRFIAPAGGSPRTRGFSARHRATSPLSRNTGAARRARGRHRG